MNQFLPRLTTHSRSGIKKQKKAKENIGDFSGYFGIAFDTTLADYDSLLLYNLSYPFEGFPNYYASPVNGDTLCMKFGYLMNPSMSGTFATSWGGDGEYVSPYFDANFRIHGMRWSINRNYFMNPKDFYFLKYVLDTLVTGLENNLNEIKWSIYPNPASNILHIQLSKAISTITG